MFFFFFKQKTAYEMRISDWSSDVCSSDIKAAGAEFAYIMATDGAGGIDPKFARNMAEAREVGVQAGAIHRYSLCQLATAQAANLLRHVPRRPAMPPAAVRLAYYDRCPDRPTRPPLLLAPPPFPPQI